MSCDKTKIFFWGTGSTRPAKDRDPPCVLIKTCAGVCILDCGEGCQRAFEEIRVGYNERLVVLITHLHGDHVLGLPPLLQTLDLVGRSRPVYIIGPLGLWRVLSGRGSAVSFPIQVTELSADSGILDLAEVLNFSLEYVRALHTPLSYSFVLRFPHRVHLNAGKLEKEGVPPKLRKLLLEKGIVRHEGKVFELHSFVESIDPGLVIAYSGDTLPNALFAAKCKGADVLIHEATLSIRTPGWNEVPHSTATDAAEIAAKARAKLLVLIHLSARYRDSEQLLSEARRVFPRTIVARKGLVLTVWGRTPRVFQVAELSI